MNKLILQEITATDLTPKEMQLVGSTGARFVRFQHAILARAETNKNQDHIDDAGIKELASTLPLTAIDDEHKKDKVIGYFTDARAVVGENGHMALDTDGVLHADRFPQETAAVMNGAKLLSIEADADKATCSECGQEFINEQAYCAHLSSRLIDRRATRNLHGLTAQGGATTYNPAGTDTHFDLKHIELIASAFGAPTTVPEPYEVLCFASEMEYEMWDASPEKYTEFMAKVLTTKERKAMPKSEYAVTQKKGDKTVKRFPINDCEHARKALQLLPRAKGLSPEEKKTIQRKAHAKLNSPACKSKSASSLQANALRAAQFFATLATDPMTPYPGQVMMRPVFSPLLAADTPDWVKAIAEAGQLGAPRHPKQPVEAAPETATVAASAEDAKKQLDAHLSAGKPVEPPVEVKAALTGFWLEPEDDTEKSKELKMEWR